MGGTGKETGDRHPKIRQGVLIGAGASILGNLEIGPGPRSPPAASCSTRFRPIARSPHPGADRRSPAVEAPALEMESAVSPQNIGEGI